MPETRTLSCILTPAELIARSTELARTTTDWSSAEEEKKNVTKLLGDKIKEHEANMKRLALIVRTGKEEREVEVLWVAAVESETMRLIRTDTGEEVMSRPMTREEKDLHSRQPALPLSIKGLPAAPPIAPPPVPAPPQLEATPAQIQDAEFEVM